MKFQNPFLFCVILAVTLFLYKKDEGNKPAQASTNNQFKLVVERGAFHYDRFELTLGKITYFPEENAEHTDIKYNTVSEVKLTDVVTSRFIEEIESKGFWKLENHYTASSSCLSELKITLYTDGKSKTVICDDFERECHELIKYIDIKIVELEGNDLKRIYLPG